MILIHSIRFCLVHVLQGSSEDGQAEPTSTHGAIITQMFVKRKGEGEGPLSKAISYAILSMKSPSGFLPPPLHVQQLLCGAVISTPYPSAHEQDGKGGQPIECVHAYLLKYMVKLAFNTQTLFGNGEPGTCTPVSGTQPATASPQCNGNVMKQETNEMTQLYLAHNAQCPACVQLAGTIQHITGNNVTPVSLDSEQAKDLLTQAYPAGWKFAPYLIIVRAGRVHALAVPEAVLSVLASRRRRLILGGMISALVATLLGLRQPSKAVAAPLCDPCSVPGCGPCRGGYNPCGLACGH